MDQAAKAELAPRFVDGKAMLFAGMSERITAETWDRIDKLWWRFAPKIGSVPGQIGARVAYGVVTDVAEGIDYLACVEVADAAGLPAGLAQARMPAQRYAVFAHDDHVTTLKATMDAIWSWWPTSELVHARADGAPAFFERYGEAFDAQKGTGGIEIWVSVRG